ncbi:Uncharacterised protein [Klebsiella pneumoniae]|nr:hypothetical protein MTE1_1761 [Klebsiella pneumoniae JHCK1]SXT04943.1 Uncharacterised protein [Klebsiella pneumoniae]
MDGQTSITTGRDRHCQRDELMCFGVQVACYDSCILHLIDALHHIGLQTCEFPDRCPEFFPHFSPVNHHCYLRLINALSGNVVDTHVRRAVQIGFERLNHICGK